VVDQLQMLNVHATTRDGKEILRGITLKVKAGEKHVIMGPNGGGKSTLAYVLMGHPGYKVTKGKILLNGKDVTKMSVDERARKGLFLGFQYPVEVAGVNMAAFLRVAVNEKTRGKKSNAKIVSPIAFRQELMEKSSRLAFSDDITKRSLNEGFSGGEKKKAEILQMTVLKPKFAVLDEPDSGLDVDALKYMARAISELDFPLGLILVTHYQRVLKYIKPDKVHILVKGRIAHSGGADLALMIEKEGYEKYQD